MKNTFFNNNLGFAIGIHNIHTYAYFYWRMHDFGHVYVYMYAHFYLQFFKVFNFFKVLIILYCLKTYCNLFDL